MRKKVKEDESVPRFEGPDAEEVLLPLLKKIPGVHLRSLWDLAKKTELPCEALQLIARFTGHTSNGMLQRVIARCLGECVPANSLGTKERSLLPRLRKLGVRATTTEDLAHRRSVPRRALRLLTRYVQSNDPESRLQGVVEVLGRSLPSGDRTSRELLLNEFRRARGDGYRWAIGGALFDSAEPWMEEDLIALVRDPRYARKGLQALQMVIMALGKLRARKSIPWIVRLLRKPMLCQAAVIALGKMRDASLIRRLDPLLADPDPEFRGRVRTAIARLVKWKRRRRGTTRA